MEGIQFDSDDNRPRYAAPKAKPTPLVAFLLKKHIAKSSDQANYILLGAFVVCIALTLGIAGNMLGWFGSPTPSPTCRQQIPSDFLRSLPKQEQESIPNCP